MIENKILSLVGPTAVGKTTFALQLIDYIQSKYLEKSFNNKNKTQEVSKKVLQSDVVSQQLEEIVIYTGFDLISADSRQVYQDLKIISGADVPGDFVDQGEYFEKSAVGQGKNIRLYGIEMLAYEDEWSVAHFREFAGRIIKASHEAGRLPIIVGGTGLYHQHLFNSSSILDIKPNQELRNEISGLNTIKLQQKLCELAEEKFSQMNKSDRKNPVRLVRAIEVATFQKNQKKQLPQNLRESALVELPKYDQLTIGLKDDLENIRKKIQERVAVRFQNGAKQEVSRIKFLVDELGVNKQLVSATGVKEILAYLDGEIEAKQCQEKWALREFQYAKRQLTWWKKHSKINWFEVGKKDWKMEAKQLVENWLRVV